MEGSSTVESGAPCLPAPPLAAATAPQPPVALPPDAVLTDVREVGGTRLVTGRSPGTVAEVLAHFRGVTGYVVVRDEDEGRAGELQLFGVAGDVGVTVARLTCPRGLTGFTLATPKRQPSP